MQRLTFASAYKDTDIEVDNINNDILTFSQGAGYFFSIIRCIYIYKLLLLTYV